MTTRTKTAVRPRQLAERLRSAREARAAPIHAKIPPQLDYAVATREDEERRESAMNDLARQGLAMGDIPLPLHAEVLICDGSLDSLPENLKARLNPTTGSVLRTSQECRIRSTSDDFESPDRAAAVRLYGTHASLESFESLASQAWDVLTEEIKHAGDRVPLGLLPGDPGHVEGLTDAERVTLLCSSVLWCHRGARAEDPMLTLPRTIFIDGHPNGYAHRSDSLSDEQVRDVVGFERHPQRGSGGLGSLLFATDFDAKLAPSGPRWWTIPPYNPGCRWLVVATPFLDLFTVVTSVLSFAADGISSPLDLITQTEASGVVGCDPKTIRARIQDGTLRSCGPQSQVSSSEVAEKMQLLMKRRTGNAKDVLKRFLGAHQGGK